MQRLCGRPGCSDAASVAYGMRPEDLVFWLDRLPERPEDGAAVLCRRHADAMIVPRGWTLDDLRDPHLHLFRPPAPGVLPAPAPSTRVRRPTPEPAGEQLRLPTETDPAPDVEAPAAVGPWSPSFDEADDLDGLLAARSPLLSRAFRTADRTGE
jgi:hypothetical protein